MSTNQENESDKGWNETIQELSKTISETDGEDVPVDVCSYHTWRDPHEEMPPEEEEVLVYGKSGKTWEYAEDYWIWRCWSDGRGPEKVWVRHWPVKAWTSLPEIHEHM
jgi:hypothetical protein